MSLRFALPLLFTALPFAVMAQESSPQNPDWRFSLGAGTVYAPAYVGAEDYQLSVYPDARAYYKDTFFASIPEGVGYNVINKDGWRVAPLAKIGWGRDEDGEGPFAVTGRDVNALRGMGDVDDALEVGGLVEYTHRPFTTKVELRQGIGGHEGMIGEAGVNYGGQLAQYTRPVSYSFGPRLVWGDSDYNNAFFGVDNGQSARSGLSPYKADSGLVSYGVGGMMMVPVTDTIAVTAFTSYDRLGEEPGDSPLVEERGSKNQFMTGLGMSYQFGY